MKDLLKDMGVLNVEALTKMNDIKGFSGYYRFLSNFYPVELVFEGLTYQSSEAAYQAQKTLNEEIRAQFTRLNAREARRKGGEIKIREDWEDVKLNIMYRILRVKFSKPHLKLRDSLIDTGNAYLEETNYWKDTYWGVYNGIGENYLGKLLMTVRDELKEGII